MMLVGNQWLRIGGILSFAVALLHMVIIFVGATAYRYFGAGEDMARAAESGSVFPALLTFVLVIIFVLWGLYALSGAGVIRRLPLLRIALIVIGVFTPCAESPSFNKSFRWSRPRRRSKGVKSYSLQSR